jgi:hypothetical protein
MRKLVTAKMVFKARRRYLMNPSLKTSKTFQRLYRAYEERFTRRRLDFFNWRVTMVGWEIH